MKAIHFGAGNIGRGFIGEILYHNQFSITFVDVNQTIINELKTRGSYEIGLADESQERIKIDRVTGLNNQEEPQAVIEQIVEADLVTTAIGPNILPFIAELVADGINEREKRGIVRPLDVIACENMISGSSFFKSEIEKYVINKDYLEQFIGFPDAAVDRIVPEQHHENPLFVEVEPFSEWVINKEQVKNKAIELEGVLYVENLQPYIERKLFSVNTGHATVAYTGALLGYQTIDEAMKDALVLAQLKSVLSETGELLIRKWGFNREEHNLYIEKIITRFKNPYISDGISRVARTPIRKLGYDERFIRPIREANELGIEVNHLIAMVGMIFNYYDEQDTESHKLADKLAKENVNQVIKEVTGIKDNVLIEKIIENINRYAKLAA